MRIKFILFTLSICSWALSANAQSREGGIMLGMMGYRGDLKPVMYQLHPMDPGIGIVYRRCYDSHWSFKAGVNYGHVEANDKDAVDAWSKNRNLMFKSSVLELTGQMEFNFLPYQTANPNSKFSPYLLIGLSVFHFNPKALYNGSWVELQPLGTEGQGVPGTGKSLYKRTSYALCYGGGFKFKVSRRFGVTIETGVRRTHTDYLDDVSGTYTDPIALRKENGKVAGILSDPSINKAPGGDVGRQRGDSSKKDWYSFTGIQITYTLSKRYIDSCRPFKIKLW